MIHSESQKERDADDAYRDRRIRTSIYCNKCGYNLRTLPYVYNCPECGNPYRARGISTIGIFTRQTAAVPFGDIIASVLFGITAFVLLIRAIRPLDQGRLIVAAVFVALTAWFVVRSCNGFQEYMRQRTVEREIAKEESE